MGHRPINIYTWTNLTSKRSICKGFTRASDWSTTRQKSICPWYRIFHWNRSKEGLGKLYVDYHVFDLLIGDPCRSRARLRGTLIFKQSHFLLFQHQYRQLPQSMNIPLVSVSQWSDRKGDRWWLMRRWGYISQVWPIPSSATMSDDVSEFYSACDCCRTRKYKVFLNTLSWACVKGF